TTHLRLVSSPLQRRRDLGFRPEQPARRRERGRPLAHTGTFCRSGPRSPPPLGSRCRLALARGPCPGTPIFRRLVLLPLILPGIITGLSLLMFAVFAGLQLSLVTVFLGHGTALISVATTELFAGLQKIDRAQEEASLDLGATPWQTFWRVTLPNLKLSLIAAGLLIFTLSMDEIAVTFFLIGRDNTLPL